MTMPALAGAVDSLAQIGRSLSENFLAVALADSMKRRRDQMFNLVQLNDIRQFEVTVVRGRKEVGLGDGGTMAPRV